MKVKDIKLSDVRDGLIWRVLDSSDDDWLEWEISTTKKVSKQDIIVHTGLILVNGERIYPYLETKYYEDGGEVGEVAVMYNEEWRVGISAELSGKVEGPYLSYISTLDIHEYQKGVFDNRSDHLTRFNHYIGQVNSANLIHYSPRYNVLPLKYQRMKTDELIDYVRELVGEIEKHQNNNQISKANKLVDRLRAVINFLKLNPDNYSYLWNLLNDQNPIVVGWMQYNLHDIFETECVRLIKIAAKQDSTNGLGAHYWLKDHGYM